MKQLEASTQHIAFSHHHFTRSLEGNENIRPFNVFWLEQSTQKGFLLYIMVRVTNTLQEAQGAV